jgi:DNA anti-recombination protein RmuC
VTLIIERDRSGKIIRYETESEQERSARRDSPSGDLPGDAPREPRTSDEVEEWRYWEAADIAKKVEADRRAAMVELAAEVDVVSERMLEARRAARERLAARKREIESEARRAERLAEDALQVELASLRAENQQAMAPLNERARELQGRMAERLEAELADLSRRRGERLAAILAAEKKALSEEVAAEVAAEAEEDRAARNGA